MPCHLGDAPEIGAGLVANGILAAWRKNVKANAEGFCAPTSPSQRYGAASAKAVSVQKFRV
jgi:hypothetical protein